MIQSNLSSLSPTAQAAATDAILDIDLNVQAQKGKRIGPVQHEDFHPARQNRFEAITHRRLKRVIAAPDILHVDDERIQILQLRLSWPQAFRRRAIETMYRHRRRLLRLAAREPDQILRLPEQSVLRPEDRRERDFRCGGQQFDRVAQLRIDRGGMRHQPRAQSAQRTELLQIGRASCRERV